VLILAQLVVPVVVIYSSLLVILEAQDQQRTEEVQNAPRVIFVHKAPLILFVLLLVNPTIVEKDVVMVSQTLKHIFVQHEVRHVQRFVQVIMQQASGIQTMKKRQEIKRKGVSLQTIVLVVEKMRTVVSETVIQDLVNALAKKSFVLLVHLVPVRNFRTLRVMVDVHLGFIVPPVQIKTMKTDVVENRVTHLAQQRFIVNLEVKHLKKSMQTTILSVVLPKPKIVHPATL
jgi:hypothetical protein